MNFLYLFSEPMGAALECWFQCHWKVSWLQVSGTVKVFVQPLLARGVKECLQQFKAFLYYKSRLKLRCYFPKTQGCLSHHCLSGTGIPPVALFGIPPKRTAMKRFNSSYPYFGLHIISYQCPGKVLNLIQKAHWPGLQFYLLILVSQHSLSLRAHSVYSSSWLSVFPHHQACGN